MEFHIIRNSLECEQDQSSPLHGAYTKKPPDDDGDVDWFIKIDTLEQLMNLVAECGIEIDKDYLIPGVPTITIVDAYY